MEEEMSGMEQERWEDGKKKYEEREDRMGRAGPGERRKEGRGERGNNREGRGEKRGPRTEETPHVRDAVSKANRPAVRLDRHGSLELGRLPRDRFPPPENI